MQTDDRASVCWRGGMRLAASRDLLEPPGVSEGLMQVGLSAFAQLGSKG